MKRKKLTERFFNRPTLTVSADLLGKFLVRRWRGREISLMITEIEAYDGLNDRASHASRGKTTRNAPMFGRPGQWYVYFTYGMHWMLNIVTRRAGYPAAVLIRGGTLINKNGELVSVSGPARLTKFLEIDGKLNGLPASRKTGLWLEDRGTKIPASKIKKGPRVGINYAGKHWAAKPWRFRIKNSG
ncbi:MAG: DNA-3-methyladenine glycosylase [Patescibacteria group bacterium]